MEGEIGSGGFGYFLFLMSVKTPPKTDVYLIYIIHVRNWWCLKHLKTPLQQSLQAILAIFPEKTANHQDFLKCLLYFI